MQIDKVKVLIQSLPHAKGLDYPAYGSQGAAGMDLTAAIDEGMNLWIEAGKHALVPTGIAISLPFGYEAQIRARSGLALKHGLAVLNAPGTIDCDYRGEIKVILINLGVEKIEISRGMRIAQMVVTRYSQVEWEACHDGLPTSIRGQDGFGSTGTI